MRQQVLSKAQDRKVVLYTVTCIAFSHILLNYCCITGTENCYQNCFSLFYIRHKVKNKLSPTTVCQTPRNLKVT